MQESYDLVILGSGSGGVSVAARIRKQLANIAIALVDSADTHYYQPLWTLAGAGIVRKQKTAKPQSSVIPSGVDWIQHSAMKIDPVGQQIKLSNGSTVGYDYLVIATGLRLAWEKIDGLEGNLGENGVCSIYDYRHVDGTAETIKNFKGGTAIFTMPPVPIKCAGAPQKIMYLADDIFRKNQVRSKTKIKFATAGKAMFAVPSFCKALDKVVVRKNIEPLFQHKLIRVNAAQKLAVFETNDEEGVREQTMPYDLLHVVPPMTAHHLISDSGLAVESGDQQGWLSVDRFTLRHTKFSNIYGIGDVLGVPNSKTGAAIRKQAPIVVQNLVSTMAGNEPIAKYDGYSSCPLVTGIGKVILAEFGYDGKLLPSFPFDQTVERRSMWHLKKDFLPILYWKGMLKGRL